jgi:hypothetical protein
VGLLRVTLGAAFPYESWIRQSEPGWTKWPKWNPIVYGATAIPGQCDPARHGFCIPYDAPGVTELYSDRDWNGIFYEDTYYDYRIVETPSLVIPEDAYWLVENPVGSSSPYYELTGLPGAYVPGAVLAQRFVLGFSNAYIHLRSLRPTGHGLARVGYTNPITSSGFDYHSVQPCLVKAATSGMTSARLSAQIAYLQRASFIGGQGDRDSSLAVYTWDGSAWTRVPNVWPTGTDYYTVWNVRGAIDYGVTVDEATSVVTGAQVIPPGWCMPLGGEDYDYGYVDGLAWPLSVRGFRCAVRERYVAASDFWTYTKIVVLWRPMGNYVAIASSPEPDPPPADQNPPPDTPYVNLGRDGCDEDALSYLRDAAIAGVGAAGWTVLGIASGAPSSTEGEFQYPRDITIATPPAPGQEVWLAVVCIEVPKAGGATMRLDYSSAFLVPGPTVLPFCLSVAGGGAIAGGTS